MLSFIIVVVIVVVVVGCLGVFHFIHPNPKPIFEPMTFKDPFQVSFKELTHNAKIFDVYGSRKELAKIYPRVKYYFMKIFRF